MKSNSVLEKMNRIKPGDHMVFLYEDKNTKSNANLMADYIIARVSKNEKCIFISGDIDIELIMERLKDSIDLEKMITNKQLLILNNNDAYSKSGKFDPRKMIDLLKVLAFEAIEEGYSAVAITGEISWVLEYDDGVSRIMSYEYLLNEEIFGSYPVSAICRYNINKFSSKMMKNIIEIHPIVIWKDKVHENPFYCNVIETEKVDVDKYKVESMLASIDKYTHIKSRFNDKIEIAEKKYKELQVNQLKNMVVALTGLLEIYDTYTKNHSMNVSEISKRIAQVIQLSEKVTNQIYYAGLVHDIGKAIVPKEIINKKTKLSEAEFDLIKNHPLDAYKALKKSQGLNHIASIVLQHHERWDGYGYPNNLKGEDICLESRIIAIADAYDAMTSKRPYREALSKEEAINEIKKNAGTQFDPSIAIIAAENVLNCI